MFFQFVTIDCQVDSLFPLNCKYPLAAFTKSLFKLLNIFRTFLFVVSMF